MLASNYSNLEYRYISLTSNYTELQWEALTPPYISIHNQTVLLAFKDDKGNLISWTTPFSSLDNSLREGYIKRNSGMRYLLLQGNGQTYRVQNMMDFVNPAPFSTVMRSLYLNRTSDEEFIHDVWHIVTELDTYSAVFTEKPKYPLETLLSGGGDCKDTSILLASMLKAANTGWDIELVYLDANNPTDPQTVNHMIVYVNTGSAKYFIETTEPYNMLPYPNGVKGWFYKV